MARPRQAPPAFDPRALIAALERHRVDYVVIGALARDRVETFDFDHRIQDNVAHSGFNRSGQFFDGFVIAMKGNSFRRKTSAQRNGQLPAGAHV